MKLLVRTIGIGCVALALQGCSSVTVLRTSEMQRINDESSAMVLKQTTQQMDSLKRELDSLRATQERMQRRLWADLSSLNNRVGDASEQSLVRQEEILYRLDLLMGASEKAIKRVIIDKQRAQGSSGAPAASAGSMADSAHEAHAEELLGNPELEELYATARSDFHRSEFKLAYEGFKKVFEKAKDGRYAENALYWMGLCLTEAQQQDKAVVLFQRVLDQFPRGTKACVVLWKLAQFKEANPADQIPLLERLTASPQCRESNEVYKALELLDQIKGSAPTP